jgi:hypothetical protein
MARPFHNTDGWWNKYIKNTGPVEYQTLYNKPHWQCIKCDFNDDDIGTVRQHIYKNHHSDIRKDTVGNFYGVDDSMGG